MRHQECAEESPYEDTMRKQLTASQKKKKKKKGLRRTYSNYRHLDCGLPDSITENTFLLFKQASSILFWLP